MGEGVRDRGKGKESLSDGYRERVGVCVCASVRGKNGAEGDGERRGGGIRESVSQGERDEERARKRIERG